MLHDNVYSKEVQQHVFRYLTTKWKARGQIHAWRSDG